MSLPLQAPIHTHGLSINIYGRGDASLGDGPSHIGIALYELNSSTCSMHHIRVSDDKSFIYDPRTQPLQDPVLKGRCEIDTFTQETLGRITQELSAFGADKSNIPEMGVGNCQDWVAGAIAVLEREGLVRTGEGEFWRSMINRSAEGVRDACLDSGRKWVPGPEGTFEGVPDARFSDSEVRDVGKLVSSPAFRERMQALLGGDVEDRNWKESEEVEERPFYLSSPFFSRRGEDS